MKTQPFEPSGPSPRSRPSPDFHRQPLTSGWSHRQERRPYTEGPSQQRPSYAQVLSQQTPSAAAAQELSISDVGDIKQLLRLLCNKMKLKSTMIDHNTMIIIIVIISLSIVVIVSFTILLLYTILLVIIHNDLF